MKSTRGFIIATIFALALHKVSAQYCPSRCSDAPAPAAAYDDYTKIEIMQGSTVVFSSTNGCGTTGTGAGSDQGRYANYRNQIIRLKKGQTYTLNAYFSACSAPFYYGYSVMYLDLNKNYQFDTTTERFCTLGPVTLPSGGTHTFSSSFTIPSTVSIDSTCIRFIVGNRLTTPNNYVLPCDTNFAGGETEDYTVTFCDNVSRSLTKVNPKCFGDSTGKIKIYTTGGLAPIQFSWNGGTFLSLDSLKNIPAGAYSIITKDSLGCKYYDTVNITQPTQLVLNKLIDSTCWDSPNGKITVNATGGTQPYSYQFNTNSYGARKVWDTLSKGIYIINVKDSNLCQKSDTLIIDTFRKFNHYYLVDSVHCFNSSTGTIGISSTTPSKFNGFSLNNNPYQSSGIFGFLASGTYYLKSRDFRNCLYYDTVLLDNPAIMTIQLVKKQDVGCKGINDGIIKVKRNGGRSSLTYSYKWSHLAGLTTLDSFGNLTPGMYKIVLQDQYLCALDSIIVKIGSYLDSFKPDFLLLASHKCNYDSLNIIRFIAKGGSFPFQYSHNLGAWSSKDTAHIKHNISSIFTGNIRIKDTNGCVVDTTYTIRPESYLTLNADQTIKPACGGSTSVVVEFKISQPDYSKRPLLFSFNNSPFQTDSFFRNIVAQNSTLPIVYKDAIGCIYSDSIKMSAYQTITSAVNIQPNVCIGDKIGQISLSTTGGVVPYQYSINGGSYQTSNIFSNLSSGLYTISIKDFANCMISKSVNIPSINFTFNLSQDSIIKCYGDSTGQITALLTGSTPSYAFQNGAYGASNVWSNLKAGVYNIKIKYNTSCTIDTNITLTQPPKLNNSITKTDNPCFSQKNGTITTTPSGGISPYKTYINSSDQGTVTQFLQLASGNYEVKLQDQNKCHNLQNIYIGEPIPLVISKDQIIQPSCANKNGGSITISVSGGTSPYSTKWSTGDNNILNKTNLGAGSYKIVATDKNACADSAFITMTRPDTLGISLIKKEMTCFNDTNASLEVKTHGGNAPFNYIWNDGSSSKIRTALQPNIYYHLSVSDSRGCEDTAGHIFVNPPELSLTIKTTDATCYNSKDGDILAYAKGGMVASSSDYWYSLDQLPRQKSGYFQQLNPKQYTIKAFDSRDCQITQTAEILSFPRTTISIDSLLEVQTLGTTISLTPSTIGGTSDIQYRWRPSDGLSCSDCLSPIFQGYVSAPYTLIYSYNNNRCIDSVHTFINVLHRLKADSIYIPTAFSPNDIDHAENETFKVYGNYIKSIKLSIFNRWGEKVFESNDQNTGWNGTFKGELAPIGNYTYTTRIKFLNNQVIEKTGNFVLLR